MFRLLIAGLALTLSTAANAERIPSHCLAFAERDRDAPMIWKASTTAMGQDEVAVSYIGHSMFLIETPKGLSAITDFNGTGRDRAGNLPEIVTMNIAHSSHNTPNPDPDIAHVLPGWGERGARADHYVDLGEMLIRNVTTDIRGGFGGDPIPDANSIFIFEVAGLCIGHLGHLHHEPTDEQYIQMGRLDIVMAAVDGGRTVDVPTMIKIMKRVRASVVLPMHWWGNYTLEQFIAGMSDEFAIQRVGDAPEIFSIHKLPERPTVMVMQPRYKGGLSDD